LAVVEILVHYSVLPRDFVMTAITVPAVPDDVSISDVPNDALVDRWEQPIPLPQTQEYGKKWIATGRSAVLRVPSVVVPDEWNYLINVRHANFVKIAFGPSEPFHFDPRLK